MNSEQNLKEEEVKDLETDYKFDVWYAEAWSRKQGKFSFNLANNLIRYLSSKHRNVKSVLDICSGSGEFISIMRNACTDCVGVDNADGYLELVRTKYSDINFVKVDALYDFNLKRKFDVVSCNRDVVNMFTDWEQWVSFFKTAYAHLNKNGIFMFDFYTQNRLEGWNELIFEQEDGLDYVSKITQNNGYCVFNEVYYLKETNTIVRKTGDIMVEGWFETERILNALDECGFRDIKFVDINLNEVNDVKNLDRIHIIATK